MTMPTTQDQVAIVGGVYRYRQAICLREVRVASMLALCSTRHIIPDAVTICFALLLQFSSLR